MNRYERLMKDFEDIDEFVKFCTDNFDCETSYCPCAWSNEYEDCGDDCYGAIKSWLLEECE